MWTVWCGSLRCNCSRKKTITCNCIMHHHQPHAILNAWLDFFWWSKTCSQHNWLLLTVGWAEISIGNLPKQLQPLRPHLKMLCCLHFDLGEKFCALTTQALFFAICCTPLCCKLLPHSCALVVQGYQHRARLSTHFVHLLHTALLQTAICQYLCSVLIALHHQSGSTQTTHAGIYHSVLCVL